MKYIVTNMLKESSLIVSNGTEVKQPTMRKTDRGENCIMMNFTACILHRILLGSLNQGK
jgi:hypothetical protein